MKSITSLIILILVACTAFSQGRLKSDEVSSLLKRKLIVELVESDQLNLLNEEGSYNDDIKAIITEHWPVSSEVEFKSTSEIEKLVQKGSSEYAFLLISQSAMSINYKVGQVMKTNEDFRFTLNLVKAEDLKYVSRMNQISRHDGFAMPIIHTGDVDQVAYHELLISIRMMRKYMDTFIKKGSKLGVSKYFKSEAEVNCSSIGDQDLMLENSLLYADSPEKAQDNYGGKGEVKIATKEQIQDALEKSEDVLVGVAVPWKITSVKSGATMNSTSFYTRSIINLSTLEICSFHDNKVSGLTQPAFKVKEFKKLGTCD